MRAILLIATIVAVAAGSVAAQSASLAAHDTTAESGESVGVSITLDNSFETRGWSFGLCVPPGDASIASLDIGPDLAAVNDGSGPDFYNPALYAGGATIGVVISYLHQDSLPIGTGHQIHIANIVVNGSVGSAVPVCFCDSLGSPPVSVVITDPMSVSFVPEQLCGEIEIVPSVMPTVTDISPRVHSPSGGRLVSISGSQFPAGVANVAFGATLRPVAQQFGDGLIEVFAPPLPVGTYPLSLVAADGSEVVTVADAIDVRESRLPPLSDISWTFEGDDVVLTWKSPTTLDTIEVVRDGQLIASLTGDVEEFVDQGIADTSTYELTGLDASGQSSATATFTIATRPCPPPLCFPLAGEQLLGLTGDTDAKLDGFFELTDPAPGGLRIVTLADRQTIGGWLEATIYPVGDPDHPIARSLAFGQSSATTGARPIEAYITNPVAAGQYIVEVSVADGTAGTTHFQIVSSHDSADAGAPFPCPPYPFVHVEPLCGDTPPFVNDIEEIVPRPFDADAIVSAATSWSTSQLATFSAADGYFRMLRVDAEDIDGSVVRYHWTFGDGAELTSCQDTVSHLFTTAGFHDVDVTIEDDDGLLGFASKTLSIKPYVAATADLQIDLMNLDPTDTLIPDLESIDVFRTYLARVVPSIGHAVVPSSVRVEIVDPTTGLSVQTVNPANPTVDPTVFSATFNISDLPNRSNVWLRVSASDSGGQNGVVMFDLPLCIRPELGADATWSYDEPSGEYRIVGSVDAGTLYNETFSLGTISPSLASNLPFHVEFQFRLRDRQWYADDLRAVIGVALIGSSTVSSSISLKSSYTSLLACPDFGIRYVRDDIEIFEHAWSLPIVPYRHLFGTTILILGIPTLYIDVYGNLTVAVGFDVDLDLDVALQTAEPHFDLEACFRPQATLSAIGSVDTQVHLLVPGLKIFSAVGTLYPELSLSLPIQLDIERAPDLFDLRVQDYWSFDIDYRITGKFLWHRFDTGRTDLDQWDFHFIQGDPPTCYVPGVAAAGGPPVESVFEARTPKLATSADGSRSLLVYVDDVPVAAELSRSALRYATRVGDTWSASDWVFPSADVEDREPAVVFSDANSVWIAWTRNAWTEADVSAAALDPDSVNEYYRSNEIYCAKYTFGNGWSAPIRVTDDDRYQGDVTLAASGPDGVCVAWVTREDASLISTDGTLVDSALSLESAFVSSAGALPPTTIATGGIDHAPCCDFIASTGRLVWIEDTIDSSRLMTSAFDGSAWSAPESLLDADGETLDTPSLVLDSSIDTGLIAFTRRAATAGPVALGFGDRLGIVELAGSLPGGTPASIDHSFSLDRCASATDSESISVRAPQVSRIGDSQYVISGRVVASDGPSDVDPEVGLIALDASGPTPAFSAFQMLTDDGIDQLEPVVTVDTTGQIVAAWNEIDAEPEYGGLVLATSELASDMALGAIRVSNPWPQPGERMVVDVELRNLGLASPPSTPIPVELGTLEDGEFLPVDQVDVDAGPWPGQAEHVALEYVARSSDVPLVVRVVPDGSDLDATNDERELHLGVRAPEDVACQTIAEATLSQTLITWTNAQIYDRMAVLRDGVTLVELIGTATSYVDVDSPTSTPVYTVKGFLAGRGSVSTDACSPQATFIRGDANQDGNVDLADGIHLLQGLFSGGAPSLCADAVDANDDGQINIGDAVSILSLLFTGGAPPPPPYPTCGSDPTADLLDCAASPNCP